MTGGFEGAAAREELYAVMRADGGFEEKAERALDIGERYLGVDNGHVTSVDPDSDYWKAVASTDPAGGSYPAGEVLSLSTTYCRRTIRSDEPVAVHHAGDTDWREDPAYAAQGLECYHGTTIVLDDEPWGTVCFVSSEPREEPFSEEETMFAALVARLLEHELERERTTERIERLERFANVVSHDLRNPLNVATGRVDVARDQRDSEHLRVAAESLERMDDIVSEVLTMARQGRDVEETEAVHLETVVEECWQNVDTAGGSLRVVDDLQFQASLNELRHLLENLIRNAVDHGGTDATVRVGPLPDEEGFYVADDGLGIPEGAREEVFESGYTTGADGVGLGLSIVDGVASAHHWSVGVTESWAGGARFEFSDVVVRPDG